MAKSKSVANSGINTGKPVGGIKQTTVFRQVSNAADASMSKIKNPPAPRSNKLNDGGA